MEAPVDPPAWLSPAHDARLRAAGIEKINTIPGFGNAIVQHRLPEGVFMFMVRLNRPEWAGKDHAQILDLLEKLLLEGIQMRRDLLAVEPPVAPGV